VTIWDEEAQAGLGDRWTRDATDWDALVGQRLIEAVGADADDTGTALVAESRTGVAVPKLAEARPGLRRIMVVDPDRELLNLARETASDVASPPLFFNGQGVQTLNFADDVFSVAVCCGGIATEADGLNALSELERVVAPGGAIAVAALGAGSFAGVCELLREAAWASDRDHAEAELDERLAIAVTRQSLVASAERLGLEVVASGVETVEVLCDSGEAVCEHALLDAEWWPSWGIVAADPDAIRDELTARAKGWFGDEGFVDEVHFVWLHARVVEPEPVEVDDVDVVDEDDVLGLDEDVVHVHTTDVEVVGEIDADGEDVLVVHTGDVEAVAALDEGADVPPPPPADPSADDADDDGDDPKSV